MAGVTKAIGDGLTALNLFGGASNLQVWNRGGAGMEFKHPGNRENAYQSSGCGQESRQARTAPFEKVALGAPGADARPGQQRRSSYQPHQADDIEHATSSASAFAGCSSALLHRSIGLLRRSSAAFGTFYGLKGCGDPRSPTGGGIEPRTHFHRYWRVLCRCWRDQLPEASLC